MRALTTIVNAIAETANGAPPDDWTDEALEQAIAFVERETEKALGTDL